MLLTLYIQCTTLTTGVAYSDGSIKMPPLIKHILSSLNAYLFFIMGLYTKIFFMKAIAFGALLPKNFFIVNCNSVLNVFFIPEGTAE